jgi:IclR family acetate operon transcriptional repressor
MPLLQEVADSTGELVQLAVLEGTELMFIAKAEGKHRIRMLSALGRDGPLHASSVGKAYLASLPEDEALRLVAARGMPAFTPHTITTITKLLADLRKVRNLGFAVVEEEYVQGGTAIGAAVRVERLGGVVGGVSIAAPSFRVKGAQIKELGKQMIGLAARVGSIWPTHRARAAKSA